MSLSIFSSKEARHFGRNLVIFLVFSLVLMSIVSFIIRNTVIKAVTDGQYFVLPPDIDTVILGDSYLMTGLIPEMRKGTLNGAVRAEILPFTYQKVKFVCDNNPQIKNVVISLSYLSMTKERIEFMCSREAVQYNSDLFFSLYDKRLKEITFILDGGYLISWFKYTLGVPFEISKELGNYLRIILGRQSYEYYPFWGGFSIIPALTNDLNLENRIGIHFDTEGGEAEMSNILIDYFRRLNKYCNDKGIRLIAVNTPKIPEYDELVPEGYKLALREVVAEMESRYSTFYYLDYTGLELEREYLRDADHLNYQGARLFSEIFYKKMETIIQGESYDN